MGWRFRRYWNVIPGVRLNLGMRSGSVSFGVRGLHYTVGTRGNRITAGIPGTGLFWTQTINSPWTGIRGKRSNTLRSFPTNAGAQPRQTRARAFTLPSVAHPTVSSAKAQVRTPQIISVGKSVLPTYKHVFIPLWLVWAGFSVLVIGGLCAVAATIGEAFH
jgi:hypothetical protein